MWGWKPNSLVSLCFVAKARLSSPYTLGSPGWHWIDITCSEFQLICQGGLHLVEENMNSKQVEWIWGVLVLGSGGDDPTSWSYRRWHLRQSPAPWACLSASSVPWQLLTATWGRSPQIPRLLCEYALWASAQEALSSIARRVLCGECTWRGCCWSVLALALDALGVAWGSPRQGWKAFFF